MDNLRSTASHSPFAIRNLQFLPTATCGLLFLVAGCFSSPPPPPKEALAKTAQDIQRILDDEHKVPVEPIRFDQKAVANPGGVTFWFCSQPLISHAILAHPERVAAFRVAYPDLAFDHQYIGDWPVAIQKLTVSLAAGDVPDIALVKRPWLARLIDSGWAAPLDELLPHELLDDFRPVALEPLQRNGHLYALPADGFCSVLFYNKGEVGPRSDNVRSIPPLHAAPGNPDESRRDDLKTARDASPGKTNSLPSTPAGTPEPSLVWPPSTWSDLRQCAREFSQPNRDSRKALGHFPFLETLWSAGGEVCNEAKCLLGSDAAHESLDFIVSLRTDGLDQPPTLTDSDGAFALFLSRRIAMTVASSENLPYTRNAKFPVAIAPVPGKNGPVSRQSDNVLIVFAKHADAKRDALATILDFLTGPAIQDHDAIQNGSVPTRKSLAQSDSLPEGLGAAYNVSRNTPLIPAWAAIAYELDTNLGRSLSQ